VAAPLASGEGDIVGDAVAEALDDGDALGETVAPGDNDALGDPDALADPVADGEAAVEVSTA
jgi:hypothetical protein